ncbi:MAG: gamma-glutamyl-gamma-aminobutyrate hydrolase family protein [Bacteroidales bacterium]|nr:gamma-glutamyl-gamma-aminobutyrate hydrolase family protein [Bacteroidales bacterium]
MIPQHLTKGITYFLITIFLLGCSSSSDKEKIIIAISKGKPVEHYGNYGKLLKNADPEIEWVDMYHISLDSALTIMDKCSGLLVSGGPDVYPGRYGQAYDTTRCGKIDYRRDTLEFALIEKALDMELPILGICRGEQILNVFMGGSLFVDIPSDYDTLITHRCPDHDTCFHMIKIKPASTLNIICNVKTCLVNSSHHQAVNRLAGGFEVIARADDGLVEAIGWADPENHPFLLGVQWHPEGMDTTNALSITIAKEFIKHAREYSKIQGEGK